jgi:hypothetical protein
VLACLEINFGGGNNMTDAMAELKQALKKLNCKWTDIEWAVLTLELGGFNTKKALLKPGYSDRDLNQFKNDVVSLGQYDGGFNSRQQLFGDVVFKDGSWLSRMEYDGSEWWHYNIKPTYEAYIKDLGM